MLPFSSLLSPPPVGKYIHTFLLVLLWCCGKNTLFWKYKTRYNTFTTNSRVVIFFVKSPLLYFKRYFWLHSLYWLQESMCVIINLFIARIWGHFSTSFLRVTPEGWSLILKIGSILLVWVFSAVFTVKEYERTNYS